MENANESIQPENLENVQQEQETTINQEKLNTYLEKLKLEQNLPLAIGAGIATALVGAILWAIITVATKYQIGYMAIGIGFIVGFAVKLTGKGFDPVFGIVGGGLALLGCAIGNFLSVIGFYAAQESISFFSVLSHIELAAIPEIMMETTEPIDLLFYGIAVYAGYKFSFRQVTDEEVILNAAD